MSHTCTCTIFALQLISYCVKHLLALHHLTLGCCRQDLFKEFGIELSFVATRSGLTRWEEHKEKNEFEMEEDYDYDPDNPREP